MTIVSKASAISGSGAAVVVGHVHLDRPQRSRSLVLLALAHPLAPVGWHAQPQGPAVLAAELDRVHRYPGFGSVVAGQHFTLGRETTDPVAERVAPPDAALGVE